MSALAARSGAGTPMWIGNPSAFAMVHTVPRPARVGVVLCSPFGWDEVSFNRTRLGRAQRLAAAGFATVRFDWPGTGDSAGPLSGQPAVGVV